MKIALCGRKNSGKDTVAKFLNFYLNGGLGITEDISTEILYKILRIDFQENRLRYLNIAFADKLKEIVSVIYPINKAYLYKYEKNTLFYDFSAHSIKTLASATSVSLRKLLQDTADKIKKSFGENYFVENLLHDIKNVENVIVTDCRYINEYETLKKEGFYFVKVDRDTEEIDPHSSENSVINLPNDSFDFIINNNSDLNTLARNCYDLYCELVDYIRDSNKTRYSKKSNSWTTPAIINKINVEILKKPIDTIKNMYNLDFKYSSKVSYDSCRFNGYSSTSSIWNGLF